MPVADETKPRGYLAKYGEQLIKAGYEIIPIKRGTKRPPFDDWEKVRATVPIWKKWVSGAHATAGLGILTRLTPAVDIDVKDEGLSKAMQTFVESNFDFAPLRIGQAPKRLLLFRAETPFHKVQSRTWIDPFSVELDEKGRPVGHKVEVLGDGQQFVAYAIHPDTKQPFRWHGDSPRTVGAEDLPVLDEAGARQIVEEFERLAEEAGWEPRKNSTALTRPGSKLPGGNGTIASDDVFASDAQRVEDLSEEEIHRKLLLVPGAEDYDTWLQIGMALYHQFDGSERGLELWHEWSQEAQNYEASALDAKWDTFDIGAKSRAPVTARLIIKLAAEAAHEIATQTFAETVTELKASNDLTTLKAICDKIKKIEFDLFHRAQIVQLVQKRFKEITNASLAIGEARSMVRFENPKPKELPRWLEGWVYIGHSNTFYSVDTGIELKPDAFNATYNRFMLTKQDVLEGRSVPEASATQFALNNKQIETVQFAMYMPGEDSLFWFNGKRCVNTYSDRLVPALPGNLSAAEREAVETVAHHFEHLFANPTDRRFLLDSIAYLVQNIGWRMKYGVLMQGVEEDGKSFFAGLLGAVLGSDNVKTVDAEALQEKFNGWAEGAQVVFFEEIKLHGQNRYDVLNKVKPLLTNPVISLRRMNVDRYDAVNTANYFLTTNFRDALPLDDNDSRYFVVFSRFQTKAALAAFNESDPTYYDRLYGALAYGGALRQWLLGHKVSESFNPNKRAPNSAARKEMIMNSRSEEMEALDQILEEQTAIDLCGEMLNSAKVSEKMHDLGVPPPYGRAMGALLMKKGFTRLGKVRVGDEVHLLWSQNPEAYRWPDGETDTNKVRAYFKKYDDL